MKALTPDILFEDAAILVLNKPAGLVVHGDGRTEERTLADWLVETQPALKDVGEPWVSPKGAIIPRPGIVHRLDRDTSGVMVVAKHEEAFQHLKQEFKERTIDKEYLAYAYGPFKEMAGTIQKAIGRSPSDFRRWSAQPGARGTLRDAETDYEVLAQSEAHALLRLVPKTGRTHQLRVHLKAIHHPIVCDRLYAPKRTCDLGFDRTALHAHLLIIKHPNGERMSFAAPQPADFERAEVMLQEE